jgi:general secretion pathway protein A
MYLQHFGLNQPPFSISPDPQFFWRSGNFAKAFEALKRGILEGNGCLVLTGDVGTGKTSLIQGMARLDGVAAIFLTIDDPDLSALDVCNALAAELEMGLQFGSCADFVAALGRFLPQAFATCRNVLVVVDEAQRLKPEALEKTAELSVSKLSGRTPLTVFFVGQLELNRLLQPEEHSRARPNIAVHHHLEPLTGAETLSYIEHRLKVAGRDTPLFTREAISEVHRLSQGFPRLVNIVCDHALLYGYGANLERIDVVTVRECSRDLSVALGLDDVPGAGEAAAAGDCSTTAPNAPEVAPETNWRPVALLGASLAAAVVGYFLLYR